MAVLHNINDGNLVLVWNLVSWLQLFPHMVDSMYLSFYLHSRSVDQHETL